MRNRNRHDFFFEKSVVDRRRRDGYAKVTRSRPASPRGGCGNGCGAAIVGDPDQVLAKLNAYRALGIEAFILSGYPHAAECDLFARHVLPKLDHAPLQV